MSEPQVCVGIDVSKAQLDVALRPTDDGWHVNHGASGIAGLVARLRTVQPTLVVLEATDEMLQSTPGVGPILSRTLAAEVPALGVLNRQETAALIGVAPLNRCSPEPGTHW
jgi:hypothetical protein